MIFIILLSLSLYHHSLCNASPSSSFSSRLSLPAARFPTVWINFTSIFFQESILVAHSRTANTFSSAFNFPDRPSIFLSVGPSVFISSERFELREKCSELAPKLRALLMAGSIFFSRGFVRLIFFFLSLVRLERFSLEMGLWIVAVFLSFFFWWGWIFFFGQAGYIRLYFHVGWVVLVGCFYISRWGYIINLDVLDEGLYHYMLAEVGSFV